MSLFDSVFAIVIGVVLILLWMPSIFINEINNKNNDSELTDLKNNINKVIKLTKVDLTFNNSIPQEKIKYSDN